MAGRLHAFTGNSNDESYLSVLRRIMTDLVLEPLSGVTICLDIQVTMIYAAGDDDDCGNELLAIRRLRCWISNK